MGLRMRSRCHPPCACRASLRTRGGGGGRVRLRCLTHRRPSHSSWRGGGACQASSPPLFPPHGDSLARSCLRRAVTSFQTALLFKPPLCYFSWQTARDRHPQSRVFHFTPLLHDSRSLILYPNIDLPRLHNCPDRDRLTSRPLAHTSRCEFAGGAAPALLCAPQPSLT